MATTKLTAKPVGVYHPTYTLERRVALSRYEALCASDAYRKAHPHTYRTDPKWFELERAYAELRGFSHCLKHAVYGTTY